LIEIKLKIFEQNKNFDFNQIKNIRAKQDF